MLKSFFQISSEFELRAKGARGIFFLDCKDSSLARNQTISGAIPVSVTLYMPQQVFVSALAKSICCDFSVFQLGRRRASASVSPFVAPSAMVPGRKQTR